MKTIPVALIVMILACGLLSAHPAPGDSLERLPLGTKMEVLRDINIKPRTVSTLVVDNGHTGCSLRHEEAQEDRLLRAGTRVVLGSLRYPHYGFRGQLHAADLDIQTLEPMRLSCSTFRSDELTIGHVTEWGQGLLRFHFPLPREIMGLGPAGATLQRGVSFD